MSVSDYIKVGGVLMPAAGPPKPPFPFPLTWEEHAAAKEAYNDYSKVHGGILGGFDCLGDEERIKWRDKING